MAIAWQTCCLKPIKLCQVTCSSVGLSAPCELFCQISQPSLSHSVCLIDCAAHFEHAMSQESGTCAKQSEQSRYADSNGECCEMVGNESLILKLTLAVGCSWL